MTTCRCKFVVKEVTNYSKTTPEEAKAAEPGSAKAYFQRRVKLEAQYDDGLSKENRSYSRATPWGQIEFTWDNPHVNFEPGDVFYVDFTPAPA